MFCMFRYSYYKIYTNEYLNWETVVYKVVTVLLVCLCVLSTWLVVGATCSPVYCLSPLVLFTNHCFSCSTFVSLVCLSFYPPGVCSPVLICCVTSCVYVECTQLYACLFSPSGNFCSLFYFIIKKTIFLHLSLRLISLITHPDKGMM